MGSWGIKALESDTGLELIYLLKTEYDDLKKDKSWVNHYCEEMRLKIFLKWES